MDVRLTNGTLLLLVLLCTIFEVLADQEITGNVPGTHPSSDDNGNRKPGKVTTNTEEIFLNALRSSMFVDKSNMLVDFLSDEVPKAIYATLPRKFGKTMNMDMLSTFLKIPINENGAHNLASKTESRAYKEIITYKDKLSVVNNNGSFFDKVFGEYIVISLYFDIDAKSLGNFRTEICAELKRSVFEPYEKWWRHEGSEIICGNGSASINSDGCKILRTMFTEPCTERHNIEQSLIQVIPHIRRIFNKEVILLVDEFDKVVMNSLLNVNHDTSLAVLRIIHFMFGPLLNHTYKDTKTGKDTEYIRRALFTGVTPIPIGEGWSTLNTVVPFRFMQKHKFLPYYGYSDEEVRGLLEKHDMLSRSGEARIYYDGYTLPGYNFSIYNPLSINYFIVNKVAASYWCATGILRKWSGALDALRIFDDVCTLVDNYTILMPLSYQLSLRNFELIFKYTEGKEYGNSPHGSQEFLYLYEYLYAEGYLRVLQYVHGGYAYFQAPNYEVRREFRQMIIDYFTKRRKVNLESVFQIIEAIVIHRGITSIQEKELTKQLVLSITRGKPRPKLRFNEKDIRGFFQKAINVVGLRLENRYFCQTEVFVPLAKEVIVVETNGNRTKLKDETNSHRGQSDLYIVAELGNTRTIVIVQLRIGNETEAKRRIAHCRPLTKDYVGRKVNLILMWMNAVQSSAEISMGCILYEPYNAPEGRVCPRINVDVLSTSTTAKS